ncbi:Protein kinase-like domain protein [Niveomyces insectorum RCEF 264]|uniref:Protein kinase-like domain protein n=1 Tax=Niveomyces insectorum RCEF 264 TaxID=1081102 RepID=A0A167MNL8_9HYPO|nr:Protein kinase-like domain protein [Niveomyces insectorum RCEF 264]
MEKSDSPAQNLYRPFVCGVGSYGVIFALDRILAVKVCRETRDFCEREFAREQKAYALLRNRSRYFLPLIHVVPLRAIFLPRVYNDLRAVLTLHNYAFAQDRADRWMGQICGGLAFLESQGYAHADMRPDNIMVDDNDNIRIIDLGSMSSIGQRLLVGTEPFARQLTPEEAESEKLGKYTQYGLAGARSETFALGSVWYSILRGHYPTPELCKKQDINALQATYRERRFPPLAADSTASAVSADPPEMANDHIVYKCWNNLYASVAELEQVFRDRKDGTEWYRFPGETDDWIAARRQECIRWVESNGLETLKHPWTEKSQETKKKSKK